MLNSSDTFWTNPQYRVDVIDPDEDDDDDAGTLIVGLLQKERRKKKQVGLDLLTIGYTVYHVSLCHLCLISFVFLCVFSFIIF